MRTRPEKNLRLERLARIAGAAHRLGPRTLDLSHPLTETLSRIAHFPQPPFRKFSTKPPANSNVTEIRSRARRDEDGRLHLPGKSAIYCARSTLGASPRCRAFFGKQAMFIQTEVTPNPATLKFLPGRAVLESGTLDLRDPEQAAQSPLAERLFGISGISGVFFGADFIAVTKSGGEWQQLKPMILGAIMEHFMSGEPLIARGEAEPSDGGEFYETVDAETVATIKDLIETRVRPAVANDGGDITFRGFKDGVVYLNMKGACSGCPSSTATLRHGIQNLLRHYIPEVTEVRPV